MVESSEDFHDTPSFCPGSYMFRPPAPPPHPPQGSPKLGAQGKQPERDGPPAPAPRLGEQTLKSRPQGPCGCPESRTRGAWPRAQRRALPPTHTGCVNWGTVQPGPGPGEQAGAAGPDNVMEEANISSLLFLRKLSLRHSPRTVSFGVPGCRRVCIRRGMCGHSMLLPPCSQLAPGSAFPAPRSTHRGQRPLLPSLEPASPPGLVSSSDREDLRLLPRSAPA